MPPRTTSGAGLKWVNAIRDFGSFIVLNIIRFRLNKKPAVINQRVCMHVFILTLWYMRTWVYARDLEIFAKVEEYPHFLIACCLNAAVQGQGNHKAGIDIFCKGCANANAC